MLWLVLLVAWPIVEIFVAVKIADAIGVIPMLVLLVLSWPAGSWAVRAEGRIVLRHLSSAVAEGRQPTREVLDGALVLLGGLLLIIPGFVTDALGLLFLLAPTRALARRGIVRNLRSRSLARAVRFGAGRQAYDVDATAQDVDDPRGSNDRVPPGLPGRTGGPRHLPS